MILKNFIPPVLASAVLFCSSPAFAGILTTEPEAAPAETPGRNLYAEHFYAPSGQKLDLKVSGVRGFPVIKTRSRPQNAEYSIVTDFGAARSDRVSSGLKDIKAIDEYIKKNLQVANFEGVEIRKLPSRSRAGNVRSFLGRGQGLPDGRQATAEVTRVKSRIESRGGNFAKSVQPCRCLSRLKTGAREDEGPVPEGRRARS